MGGDGGASRMHMTNGKMRSTMRRSTAWPMGGGEGGDEGGMAAGSDGSQHGAGARGGRASGRERGDTEAGGGEIGGPGGEGGDGDTGGEGSSGCFTIDDSGENCIRRAEDVVVELR